MRNQNPKCKLDQSHCWRQWHTSLFHQGIKRWVRCYSADSAPLWSGTAPCWGIQLQKKGDEMKRFWRWLTALRRRTWPHSQPSQLRGSQLSSKSAQVQSCFDAMTSFSITKLPLPAPWFTLFPHFLKSTALQPWVSATGASKYARLFREFVIFSWNWPGHNGEGCQVLRTPFQACISRNRSFCLSFPDLSSATFLFLGQDKRRLRMEQIR